MRQSVAQRASLGRADAERCVADAREPLSRRCRQTLPAARTALETTREAPPVERGLGQFRPCAPQQERSVGRNRHRLDPRRATRLEFDEHPRERLARWTLEQRTLHKPMNAIGRPACRRPTDRLSRPLGPTRERESLHRDGSHDGLPLHGVGRCGDRLHDREVPHAPHLCARDDPLELLVQLHRLIAHASRQPPGARHPFDTANDRWVGAGIGRWRRHAARHPSHQLGRQRRRRPQRGNHGLAHKDTYGAVEVDVRPVDHRRNARALGCRATEPHGLPHGAPARSRWLAHHCDRLGGAHLPPRTDHRRHHVALVPGRQPDRLDRSRCERLRQPTLVARIGHRAATGVHARLAPRHRHNHRQQSDRPSRHAAVATPPAPRASAVQHPSPPFEDANLSRNAPTPECAALFRAVIFTARKSWRNAPPAQTRAPPPCASSKRRSWSSSSDGANGFGMKH